MAAEENYRIWTPDVPAWAALRTSARWEKKLAEQIARAGVPCYLPLIERVTQYKGKTAVAEIPMFPGYVFCSEADFLGNPAVPQASRNKVAQVIKTPDQAKLRAELEGISRVLTDHGLVQERLFGQPGETVRIVRGPLQGLEALIVELKPKRRQLLLQVSFLGTRLEVDVNEEWLSRE